VGVLRRYIQLGRGEKGWKKGGGSFLTVNERALNQGGRLVKKGGNGRGYRRALGNKSIEEGPKSERTGKGVSLCLLLFRGECDQKGWMISSVRGMGEK